MFRKILKTVGSLTLAFVLLLAADTAVFAAENTVDWERTGSVSVTPRSVEGEHPVIQETSFTLYQVGEAAEQNGNLVYTLTGDFSGSKAELSDLKVPGLAETLADYADAQRLKGTVQTADSEGTVRFTDLELGLYLLVQGDAAKGAYATDPFLVSVPMISDSGTEWIYDVDASPKAEVYKLVDVTVKKVWNDGKNVSLRPESISVELYDGDRLADSVTLNKANGWSYTWKELQKSDRYSVKETTVKGYTATYSQSGSVFTITNTAGTLVQTGQLNWPVPLLAGGGLGLFALGWALVFIKRKKQEN